jgi:hypothetical protein
MNFYRGRSHSVAWPKKIYRCNIDGGGLGVWSKENVRNFPSINVVLMKEAWEANSEENTRSFNYLKEGVPSITIRGDENTQMNCSPMTLISQLDLFYIYYELWKRNLFINHKGCLVMCYKMNCLSS